MPLAQAEAAIVEGILKGLAEQQGPQSGLMYAFAGIVVLLFIGSFLVLKYMLGHSKDIHEQAQGTIREIAKDHKEACETITSTFNEEMGKSREHYDKLFEQMVFHHRGPGKP